MKVGAFLDRLRLHWFSSSFVSISRLCFRASIAAFCFAARSLVGFCGAEGFGLDGCLALFPFYHGLFGLRLAQKD